MRVHARAHFEPESPTANFEASSSTVTSSRSAEALASPTGSHHVGDGQRLGRLHYIDTLRCVAALAVLFQHLGECLPSASFRAFLELSPGVFGVVVFFYISGLVIPQSVRNRPALRDFFLRRVFRIYPAYLVVLGFIVVRRALVAQAGAATQPAPSTVLANVFLVQEYLGFPHVLGVSWTLSLEFVFYGVFAIVFYRNWQRHLPVLVLLYAAGIALLAAVSYLIEQRLPLGRIGMLGAALVGYAVAQFHAGHLTHRQLLRAVVAFCGAMLAALLISFGYLSHPKMGLGPALSGWVLASALFLLCAFSARARSSRLARLRPILFIGEVSYSVYLTHGLFLPLVAYLPPPLALVAVPLATIALSWVLSQTIERPAVRLGRRLEPHLASRGCR